ncbi:MAG TPA: hypothetical protein VEP90_25535 [Methylomirabilota bacterium]|nr:hypothetical protein [Methylomirabilota bacterium]
MNTKRINVVTKVIFWLAFISLLATSIPHIAWVFYQYETGETTRVTLWSISVDFWWLVSFGIAIGIDALIAWLSFVKVLGKNRSDDNVVWLFIGLLCALSWYCNYLYAMAHNPIQKIDIWNIPLVFGLTTGSITPIIVSSVPVFVIGYTFMFSKIADTKEVTSQELAAIANELEALNIQKSRIKQAKRKSLVGDITGIVDSAKEVVTHVKDNHDIPKTVSDEQETGPIASVSQLVTYTPETTTEGLETVLASNGHHADIPVYRRKKKTS